MKNTSDHSISLVNELSEGLLLVDSREDHLMLTLLSDIFNRRCVHILSGCHGTNLDSSISNALSGNEFLVQFALSGTFLHHLNDRFLFSQSSSHIEVFSFNDMVLLSLQQTFLFFILKILLLLKIEGWSYLSL